MIRDRLHIAGAQYTQHRITTLAVTLGHAREMLPSRGIIHLVEQRHGRAFLLVGVHQRLDLRIIRRRRAGRRRGVRRCAGAPVSSAQMDNNSTATGMWR